MGNIVECLNVENLLEAHSELRAYAVLCGMREQEGVTEPGEEAVARLVPLIHEHGQIHLCQPGEIKRRWGVETNGLTVPDIKLNGQWHIAVELQEKPLDLMTGTLLCMIGHYIEQVAAGKRGLQGKYAMRDTSFGQACKYFSGMMQVGEGHHFVVRAADELVGILNGAWMAHASGTKPMYVAAHLLAGCVEQNGPALKMAVRRNASQIANVIVKRDFYENKIKTLDWQTEKGMCLAMDAATTRLIASLRGGTRLALPSTR